MSMVALSPKSSNGTAHARLRAALDLVLEREWSTVAQLASVGDVQECTVRRWRRGANPLDDLNAVTRWLAGPIDGKARMSFALALTSGTDLQISQSDRDIDFDGDGMVTAHDCMKTLLRVQVHVTMILERVVDGVVTPDELVAAEHDFSEAMSLMPAAMQAMAAIVCKSKRGVR
jgi:hypothetical protein